ncbi:cytochrome c oxidase subunit III [Nitritalea halalkaliphila LW7]|uniref:Cytochrome c oxidase subunit III n=1 Tax=Nitritalea halalkaliphila LW7 TaxID=1189621 RepID=I5C5F5_9BACT|nr:cytochrome c oxidase subunit 3 [Nitritalea halalkaliphila]EIM77057.1 cytochrome c oxidase subunit III [Nitritalea halalkaliphila LW7]
MDSSSPTWLQRLENMHPYQTLIYLGMFGSGLIFLFMTVAFLASVSGKLYSFTFEMPLSFIISTVIILASGYSTSKMQVHFKAENVRRLKNSLLSTFFLGLAFTILQFIGWKELTDSGIDFRGLPSGSFLYVLSGIHLFHLLGAMVFALILVAQYAKREKDGIAQLIMLTNPFERMRIQLFAVYWYFMDAVWIVLFVTFLLVF